MYFALDPAQRQLQDTVRAFAATHSSEASVREAMATPDGRDGDSWKVLTQDLGVVTLGSGDVADGAGGSFVDAVAVLDVLGGALYPGPYLSSVVATQVLVAVAAHDPAARLISALADGSARVATVFPRADGDHVGTNADRSALTGRFAAVPDGAGADHLLVAGADGEWFEVAADAGGVEAIALPSFDQTRRLARITLTATPARPIALAPAATSLLSQVRLAERVAMSAELAGVARQALEAGTTYATRREQFGRPIGSFQALQFWFADTALAVECAWSAVYSAAWEYDQLTGTADERGLETAERAAALAAATAGEAAQSAAEQMLQVFGGVGFTWDNPAHLYLKRAKSNRLLWGHPDEHRRRLGELLQL